MRVIIKYFRVGLIVLLLIFSSIIFAQPPFTPPGQGGTPPGNPCPGPPGTDCPQIPITGGIGFLIAAGILIGINKLHKLNKNDS